MKTVNIGAMTVQWNRSLPPRAMGGAEVVLAVGARLGAVLLFTCLYPTDALTLAVGWAINKIGQIVQPTMNDAMMTLALAVGRKTQ